MVLFAHYIPSPSFSFAKSHFLAQHNTDMSDFVDEKDVRWIVPLSGDH